MAGTSGKILHDPEIGEVVFRKSMRSRNISIRVHPTKGVSVSVPYIVPYAAAKLFFQARRGWILETMAKQKEKYRDVSVPSAEEVEVMRAQARRELPGRLAKLAHTYGFTYNKVTVKHNATNWGSCSTKGNINLNLNLVRLPHLLRDHVMLHELCHLRHPDHGPAFHLLLEHLLTDHILKAVEASDEHALTVARKAALSKAKYPLQSILTKELSSYRTV